VQGGVKVGREWGQIGMKGMCECGGRGGEAGGWFGGRSGGFGLRAGEL